MDRFFDDVTRAYQVHIEAAGKETHFLVLCAFLVSFTFIRTSAHLIRAEVSWWPGNVETKGGTHIHHLVWGILLLIVMGYLGLALEFDTPWLELVAVGFGIGMGLTLDEFALWLNLEDVYWSEQGRQSIDAVIITASLIGSPCLDCSSGSMSGTRAWSFSAYLLQVSLEETLLFQCVPLGVPIWGNNAPRWRQGAVIRCRIRGFCCSRRS